MTPTRWWWVRHAPVTETGGRIYGATDPNADTGDLESFLALATLLPQEARWVTSHLRRTRQTARSIAAAGRRTISPEVETGLGEQDFGDWHGRSYDELVASAPAHRFWLAPATTTPPNGESFADLCDRVTPVIQRLTRKWVGEDIIAVAHGGTIRAALGLALGLDPETSLKFATENLSVTRIDHYTTTPGHEATWRVVHMNLVPGLA